MQVGEVAQLRRYLPAQLVLIEVQLYDATVVVSADVVPPIERLVAQPVLVSIPVRAVRGVVEGDKRFPLRSGWCLCKRGRGLVRAGRGRGRGRSLVRGGCGCGRGCGRAGGGRWRGCSLGRWRSPVRGGRGCGRGVAAPETAVGEAVALVVGEVPSGANLAAGASEPQARSRSGSGTRRISARANLGKNPIRSNIFVPP